MGQDLIVKLETCYLWLEKRTESSSGRVRNHQQAAEDLGRPDGEDPIFNFFVFFFWLILGHYFPKEKEDTLDTSRLLHQA